MNCLLFSWKSFLPLWDFLSISQGLKDLKKDVHCIMQLFLSSRHLASAQNTSDTSAQNPQCDKYNKSSKNMIFGKHFRVLGCRRKQSTKTKKEKRCNSFFHAFSSTKISWPWWVMIYTFQLNKFSQFSWNAIRSFPVAGCESFEKEMKLQFAAFWQRNYCTSKKWLPA